VTVRGSATAVHLQTLTSFGSVGSRGTPNILGTLVTSPEFSGKLFKISPLFSSPSGGSSPYKISLTSGSYSSS